MTAFHRQPFSRKDSGFSLIEIIGVLAIMTIMLSIAVPSIITKINSARVSAEIKELPVLGDALERHILRTKTIPMDEWANAIAEEMAVSLAKVTTSIGGHPRIFLVDPDFSIGNGIGSLPYTQPVEGSAIPPGNARIMIISSQSVWALPKEIRNGYARNAAVFNDIWDTARGEIPSDWLEWKGKGDELQIYRINLAPLFHRLVVDNINSAAFPEISIAGSPPFWIPAEGLNGFYLEGTLIEFHKNGSLESRDILTGDRGFVFERGLWRGQLWEGEGKDATRLAKALDDFISVKAPGPPGNQKAMIDAYYNFVLFYATWSRAGFPSYDESDQITPEYLSLLEAQNQMDTTSDNLIYK